MADGICGVPMFLFALLTRRHRTHTHRKPSMVGTTPRLSNSWNMSTPRTAATKLEWYVCRQCGGAVRNGAHFMLWRTRCAQYVLVSRRRDPIEPHASPRLLLSTCRYVPFRGAVVSRICPSPHSLCVVCCVATTTLLRLNRRCIQAMMTTAGAAEVATIGRRRTHLPLPLPLPLRRLLPFPLQLLCVYCACLTCATVPSVLTWSPSTAF